MVERFRASRAPGPRCSLAELKKWNESQQQRFIVRQYITQSPEIWDRHCAWLEPWIPKRLCHSGSALLFVIPLSPDCLQPSMPVCLSPCQSIFCIHFLRWPTSEPRKPPITWRKPRWWQQTPRWFTPALRTLCFMVWYCVLGFVSRRSAAEPAWFLCPVCLVVFRADTGDRKLVKFSAKPTCRTIIFFKVKPLIKNHWTWSSALSTS